MTAHRPAPPGADDDQQWFDLLAGRRVQGADAHTQADAGALRAALLRHAAAAPEGQPAAPDVRIGRLLARARAEGVLPRPQPAEQSPPLPAALRRRRPRIWPGALAAGVAVLGLTVLLLQRPAGDPAPAGPVLRGATVQLWPVADPAQRRQELLQALRAAGFDAQPFDRLGRPGLDIVLPVPLAPAQARALAALGISAPAGPSLLIELLPAAPASAPAR